MTESIEIRQDIRWHVAIDYYPDGDNRWERYSVVKSRNLEDFTIIEPARISVSTATRMTAVEAMESAVYLAAMSALATQLDRLVTQSAHLERQVTVTRRGLVFEVELGELIRESEATK